MKLCACTIVFLGLVLFKTPAGAQLPGTDSTFINLPAALIQNGTTGYDSVWISGLKTVIGYLKNKISFTQILKNNVSVKKTNKINTGHIKDKTDSVIYSIKSPASNKPNTGNLVAFKDAYIQYNYHYQNLIDTPFYQQHFQQHTLSAGGSIYLFNKIPFNYSYNQQSSNSPYFKDYRDFTFTLDANALQHINQKNRLHQLRHLTDKAENKLLQQQQHQLPVADIKQIYEQLSSPALISLIIQCREILSNNAHITDSLFDQQDSVVHYAQELVNIYDEKKIQLEKVRQTADSLTQQLQLYKNKLVQFKESLNNGMPAVMAYYKKHAALLADSLGIGDNMEKLPYPGFLKKLSAGRSLPDFNELTVKNTYINGINFSVARNIFFMDVAAGLIDYRYRDFVFNKLNQTKNALMGAVKLGLGNSDASYMAITGFTGKKQVFQAGINGVTRVSGASLEAQWLPVPGYKFGVIISQGIQPNSSPGVNKPAAKFTDKEARAIKTYANVYVAATQSSINGYYIKEGASFQALNSYRIIAGQERWNLQLNQYLLRRQLYIKAGIQKNNIEENILLTTPYSSNRVLTTLLLSYRKPKMPSVSIGYQPSTQYTVMDSLVYENRFQTATANINHNYKIGTARGLSNISYIYFNSNTDSNYLYYKAHNISAVQHLVFQQFFSTIEWNSVHNKAYSLRSLSTGIGINTIKNNLRIEGGIKINDLNNNELKTGGYGRINISLVKIAGELTVLFDQRYLPDMNKQLVLSRQFNAGYIQYLKFKK